jgi:5-methylcytosine-specific restriction endonuclease McrA
MAKEREVECAVCGTAFTTKHGQKKRCDDCIAAGRQTKRYKNKEPHDVVCDCGTLFATTHATRKRCDKCSEVPEAQDTHPRRGWLILERDWFKCVYCGTSAVSEGTQLHIDHVIPRDLGGREVASNLVTACKPCNLSKAAAPMHDEQLAIVLEEVAARNEKYGIAPDREIKL